MEASISGLPLKSLTLMYYVCVSVNGRAARQTLKTVCSSAFSKFHRARTHLSATTLNSKIKIVLDAWELLSHRFDRDDE